MNRDQRIIVSYVHNDNEIHKQYRYRTTDFDYALVGFGYHQTPPGYSYGPLIRDFAIIHLVIRGHGKAVVDSREHTICENQCFLFRPNQMHYYESSKDDPWAYYYFSFCGSGVDEILEEMGFADNTVVRSVTDSAALIRLLQQLCDTIDETLTTYVHQGLLSLLIHQFVRMSLDEQKPVQLTDPEFRSDLFSTRNYLGLARGIIHNNYAERITAEDIARQLNLSIGYLNVLFKREMNQTVHHYLTEYRLKKGVELLETTSKQIVQIANEVGFSDPLYFSRIFTKFYRVSPKQYRSMCQRARKEQ